MTEKKLRRSKKDRIIAGVIGGMAAYFGIDSVLLRLIAAFAAVVTGVFPFILFYLIAWIVMPEEQAPADGGVRIHDV